MTAGVGLDERNGSSLASAARPSPAQRKRSLVPASAAQRRSLVPSPAQPDSYPAQPAGHCRLTRPAAAGNSPAQPSAAGGQPGQRGRPAGQQRSSWLANSGWPAAQQRMTGARAFIVLLLL